MTPPGQLDASAQAAPDVRIGGGQWRQAPKEPSKPAWGPGASPLRKFFNTAKCCNLGRSLIFLRPWGGHGPPPPGSRLCVSAMKAEVFA